MMYIDVIMNDHENFVFPVVEACILKPSLM